MSDSVKIRMQNNFQKHSFLLFLTSFMFILVYYYNRRRHDSDVINTTKIFSIPPKRDKDKVVIILFWTNYFGEQYHTSWFFRQNCSKTCVLVFDRSSFDLSDAVLFHSRDTRTEDLPKSHPENQIWVYLQKESPVNTKIDLTKFSDLFNWTMTYRLDSDVYDPYFKVRKRKVPEPNSKILTRRRWRRVLKQKTKLVAWVASNCHVQSRREDYVKELQRFIPVDIYGKCGALECTREGPGCFSDLGRQYKFYLSFENSYCRDYITEKLQNALKNNLVPIVMGGGNYESFGPPGSVINVDEFESVEALANYLLYLDGNETEYLKYFEWQESYEIVDGDGFCELCEKLRVQKISPRRKVYGDLWKWWRYIKVNGGNYSIFDARDNGDEVEFVNAADHTVPACHGPTWMQTSSAKP